MHRTLGFTQNIRSRWERYEGPTWVVAACVYVGWAFLIAGHARLPWWCVVPCGGVLVAWHNSLQHETIHAMVRVPRPVRYALGYLPLGLAMPYPIYCRNHRRHHRDAWLTDPAEDPESFYHDEDAWRRYPRVLKWVFICNQTMVGRVTIGPLLAFFGFVRHEVRRVVAGDRRNLRDWAWHAVAIAALLATIQTFAGMTPWQYVLLVVYPGMCLGMLRSFYEHRYAASSEHRTAIVESGFPLSLLFLNNNLHLVHHRSPALPWYRIPAAWRASRNALLVRNGGFYSSSYRNVAFAHALRPTFLPMRSRLETAVVVDCVRIPDRGSIAPSITGRSRDGPVSPAHASVSPECRSTV